MIRVVMDPVLEGMWTLALNHPQLEGIQMDVNVWRKRGGGMSWYAYKVK